LKPGQIALKPFIVSMTANATMVFATHLLAHVLAKTVGWELNA